MFEGGGLHTSSRAIANYRWRYQIFRHDGSDYTCERLELCVSIDTFGTLTSPDHRTMDDVAVYITTAIPIGDGTFYPGEILVSGVFHAGDVSNFFPPEWITVPMTFPEDLVFEDGVSYAIVLVSSCPAPIGYNQDFLCWWYDNVDYYLGGHEGFSKGTWSWTPQATSDSNFRLYGTTWPAESESLSLSGTCSAVSSCTGAITKSIEIISVIDFPPSRPVYYDPDDYWIPGKWDGDTYTPPEWKDTPYDWGGGSTPLRYFATGGGRWGIQLVAVGHGLVYYEELD